MLLLGSGWYRGGNEAQGARGREGRVEPALRDRPRTGGVGVPPGPVTTPDTLPVPVHCACAVDADAPGSHVARSMLDGHLHRLLVIEDRKVVGIISTSDLLRLLAESDEQAGE